jgi:hypothetical protein
VVLQASDKSGAFYFTKKGDESMFTHRKTAALAINESIEPDKFGQLHEVRLHLSAAGGAGNLTVTLDANAGAAYDTVLLTQDMTLVTDLLWQPTLPIPYDKGDKIAIAWANGSSRTYGLEVKFS